MLIITPQPAHLAVLLDIIEKVETHHFGFLQYCILYPTRPVPAAGWFRMEIRISTALPSGHPECCRRASDADH